jgi:hypothetical protein
MRTGEQHSEPSVNRVSTNRFDGWNELYLPNINFTENYDSLEVPHYTCNLAIQICSMIGDNESELDQLVFQREIIERLPRCDANRKVNVKAHSLNFSTLVRTSEISKECEQIIRTVAMMYINTIAEFLSI